MSAYAATDPAAEVGIRDSLLPMAKWEIIHGDSLLALRELPSSSVDIMITDPPYSSGGMVRGDRMISTSSKYVRSDAVNQGVDFTGDNRDQRGFTSWCSLWLAECRRILRPHAWAIVFTDWRQLPASTDAIQAGGFVWKGIIPWHKPSHRRIQGSPSYACEYAVVGCNGPVDRSGPQIEGFYSKSAPSDRVHQTQKPAGLIKHILGLARPSSVVLDPFAGSGTTGVVAVSMGHSFIGLELSEHYAKVARERIGSTAIVTTAQQAGLF